MHKGPMAFNYIIVLLEQDQVLPILFLGDGEVGGEVVKGRWL